MTTRPARPIHIVAPIDFLADLHHGLNGLGQEGFWLVLESVLTDDQLREVAAWGRREAEINPRNSGAIGEAFRIGYEEGIRAVTEAATDELRRLNPELALARHGLQPIN